MASAWQTGFFSLTIQDEYKFTILMGDFWRRHIFVPLSFVINPWFWNEVYQFVQHKIPGCASNLSRYNLLGFNFQSKLFFIYNVFKAKTLQPFFFFPFTVLMCFFGDDNKLLYPKSEIFSLCLENSIEAKDVDVSFCFNPSSCINFFYFGLYIFSRFPVLGSAGAWLSFSE